MNQLGWKIDKNKKDFEGKQRFSIRKLTIGACSVLLGTLLWTKVDQQVVHADTTEGGMGMYLPRKKVVESRIKMKVLYQIKS